MHQLSFCSFLSLHPHSKPRAGHEVHTHYVYPSPISFSKQVLSIDVQTSNAAIPSAALVIRPRNAWQSIVTVVSLIPPPHTGSSPAIAAAAPAPSTQERCGMNLFPTEVQGKDGSCSDPAFQFLICALGPVN